MPGLHFAVPGCPARAQLDCPASGQQWARSSGWAQLVCLRTQRLLLPCRRQALAVLSRLRLQFLSRLPRFFVLLVVGSRALRK
jgi:hypothetical protein